MPDQADRLRAIVQARQGVRPINVEGGFSRIVAVTSGKGGVGKTNLVVNLALALGQLGQKVVILDADVGLANVHILMGFNPSSSLADVLQGGKKLEEVMLQGPFNVRVIPGGSALAELVNLDGEQKERLLSRLASLENKGQMLLVDCPAGMSRHLLSFLAAAGEIVVLTAPEPTAIADAYSVIKYIDRCGLRSRLYLAVNLASSAAEGEKVFRHLKDVCRRFLSVEPLFLGSIEYDAAVKKAVLKRNPCILQFPRSRYAENVLRFARRLLGEGAAFTGRAERENENEAGFLKRLLALWS